MSNKNRVGRKKNKIKNELLSLGIDVDNIDYKLDPDKLPTERICFSMLRHHAKSKGYKSGWSLAKFNGIFDKFPVRKWNSDPLIIPNKALMAYVYASNRAWLEKKT